MHRLGASEQLGDLLTSVTGVGAGSSLAAKVKSFTAKVDAGNSTAACNALAAFAAEVRAQSGKSIPRSDADALLAAAAQVSAVLGR
jgi:hypothetical protein